LQIGLRWQIHFHQKQTVLQVAREYTDAPRILFRNWNIGTIGGDISDCLQAL
jgi:hypothetical protein